MEERGFQIMDDLGFCERKIVLNRCQHWTTQNAHQTLQTIICAAFERSKKTRWGFLEVSRWTTTLRSDANTMRLAK
jgi:hypothetical protein